jgi:hypothetical protein
MRRQNQVFVWLLMTPLLLAPLPAPAATIASVTIVKNAGNTADYFDDVGNIASAVQSTASVTASTSTTFDTRYAAVVSADRGASGGPGTTTRNFTGDFTITLALTETASTPWASRSTCADRRPDARQRRQQNAGRPGALTGPKPARDRSAAEA